MSVDAGIAVQAISEETGALAVLAMFNVGGLCIETLQTLLAVGQARLHERFETQAWVKGNMRRLITLRLQDSQSTTGQSDRTPKSGSQP